MFIQGLGLSVAYLLANQSPEPVADLGFSQGGGRNIPLPPPLLSPFPFPSPLLTTFASIVFLSRFPFLIPFPQKQDSMNPAQGWTRVNFLGPDPTRPKTSMAVTNNRTIYLKSHYCNIVSIEVDLEILITCLMQNTSKLQTCTSSYFTRLKIKKQ